MTFKTLIDVIVSRSGDDSGTYREQIRNWLNLTRSIAASQHTWRSSVDSTLSITTAADTTSGIYSLGSNVEYVVGSYLYDETNNNVISHESLADTQLIDVDKDTTGDPDWWADAGMNSSGNRLIYLWPIPDGTYTIRFTGLKRITDIEEGDESLTVDPYFGPLSPWAGALEAGLDYYYRKDNGEEVNGELVADRMFMRAIKDRKRAEGAGGNARIRLQNVRQRGSSVMRGRFDPAHYNNRSM
jgi:hypothetical protein